MTRTARLAILITMSLSVALVVVPAPSASAFPQPSPYPIAWELDFTYDRPQRIVVEIGDDAPKAYWFLTYTVTNNTNQERTFLPQFEMLTKDGQVIRSDQKIPYQVFQAIDKREGNEFLEHFTQVGGEIRLGEEESKDGVAIWEEPNPEMGRFSIFVGGLSGEAVFLKDSTGQDMTTADGKPVILRKTLQLNYHMRGDEVYPGSDPMDEQPKQWIMR